MQAKALVGPADLGGAQSWEVKHDLGSDTATLACAREENQRLDGFTKLATRHSYEAKVSSANPQATRMSATTRVEIDRPVTRTVLESKVVATAHDVSIAVDIAVDGQPFWSRRWTGRRGGPEAR
jgi:hypothetical protein